MSIDTIFMIIINDIRKLRMDDYEIELLNMSQEEMERIVNGEGEDTSL